ncbi:MAG: MarR family winged helix-turn-helix transcriptional regulator [Rhodoferax sp.]|nr:MarR family winged helix-turn-helix transcriptional regulator [Rhodoferax sp.]
MEPTQLPSVKKVDTRYLESLLGYNARMAALTAIKLFLDRLSGFGLRPVSFSVLSLIMHNPGITSRQLCKALGLQASNLVAMINEFENSGWIERHPHPQDGRAMGLHPTPPGLAMMQDAEATASQLELEISSGLTEVERKTLLGLLKKVYK